jgi:P-type Mg2+ transporter
MNRNMLLLVTLDNKQVLDKLDSSEQGLTNINAQKRQILYGKNDLGRKPYRSVILESISNSTNPLVIILVVAALLSAFTGNMINAGIIITIIIFSVGLDYFQSRRALVAVKKLQQQIAATATVLRDGQWIEISFEQLVPGDIIRLVAGDLVPADSLLLKAKDIHVHQSALTGESLPVKKESILEEKAPHNPIEARNAVFSGSTIVNGIATAVVVNTGSDLFGEKKEHVMLMAYLTSLFGTEISNPFKKAVLKKASINPLDMAILKHDHPNVQKYSKIDEIPFDFERRRSSVVVDRNEIHLLITKGAPEYVMKVCSTYDNDGKFLVLNDEIRKQCDSMFSSLSQQGYRVLAVAYRKVKNTQTSYHAHDEKEMVFAGFLAFNDPPLNGISTVIKELHQQGVKVKIITGDNDLVAAHVCKQVGLDVSRIVLGEELDHISDSALGKIAEETDVFARISPVQKQRIIIALKTRGHVVGYLGDGINDAPSLHSADVGISVAGAVDIARESADIILLRQDLGVLLNGIIEGRKSFGNVMKYLMMGTSSNFGNMLSMAGAVIFLPFLPMLPIQILLNNMLYDTSQITIPTDNVDNSFIKKPKHWNIDIIKKFMFYIGPISSIFDFLTFYVMLKVFAASEALFQTGWFVESLATQTLVIFVIRTAKNPWQSRPSLSLTLMVLAVVSIGILLPFSPLAKYWGFVPLPSMYFLFLTVATLFYLILVEIIKKKLMWRWLEK